MKKTKVKFIMFERLGVSPETVITTVDQEKNCINEHKKMDVDLVKDYVRTEFRSSYIYVYGRPGPPGV
jgi:hypothetical protein